MPPSTKQGRVMVALARLAVVAAVAATVYLLLPGPDTLHSTPTDANTLPVMVLDGSKAAVAADTADGATTPSAPTGNTPHLHNLPAGVNSAPAPVPLGPYAPPKGSKVYDCDLPPVLFVNNYVEGLGNWLKGWTSMLSVARGTGRALVEPCMFSAGAVACSYGRLVDDADQDAGYRRAFKEKSDGTVPSHVFPFTYYFTLHSAKVTNVTVIPYKRFISCAVAAQEARAKGLPPPKQAGPPQTRLQVPTLFRYRFPCDLYRYEAPSNQSEFAVSEDIQAQNCVKLEDAAAAVGPDATLAQLVRDTPDPVIVLIDVWNRDVQWGLNLPDGFPPYAASRLYISDFHVDAVRRFASYIVEHYDVPMPTGQTDPLKALSVFHWRSETVTPLVDNHLTKCATLLGRAARGFLNEFYGKSHARSVGVIMSDLPTAHTVEKWLSYIGKDGRDDRMEALPAMIAASRDGLLDYSEHSLAKTQNGAEADKLRSSTAAAVAVDTGVVTIRELTLALYAKNFVSCEEGSCKLCCRTHSAFTRLIHYQRRTVLDRHAKTLSFSEQLPEKLMDQLSKAHA